jgi:hypothetical protein
MKKLFVFSLLLFLSLPLSAFEIKEIQITSGLRSLRWNTSHGPVKITLNSKGSDDVPISEVENSVRGALNEWQSVPNHSLTFEYEGTSSQAVENDSDQINSIVWIEKKWPLSSSVLGVTKYSYFLEDPPELFDVDILMNGEDQHWSTSPDPGTSHHPQQVLMHELGHLLGMTHSSVINAILYPFLSSDVRLKLSKDDRAAIKFLYGAPVVNFQMISPIQGAVFADNMTDQGLPLPVLRWGGGGLNDYTVEFSATRSFENKKTVAVGQSTAYRLTSSMTDKLMALSPAKNVFWRVVSGSSSTNPRVFRFRQPGMDKISRIGAILGPDLELEEVRKEAAILFMAGILISVLLIALLRYRSAQKKVVATK